MQEDLQYLRERVDGIADVLSRNTAVLEQNTESLREHMLRTDQNEEMIQELMRYRYYLLGFTAAVAALSPLLWKLFHVAA